MSIAFNKTDLRQIENLEKHLPAKRKMLLYAFRENNWEVVDISDDNADWAYDQKWIIESTRENKGFALQLWFFKYDGLHDGMDRVVSTTLNAAEPSAYGGGEPSIEFDGRKFENQLSSFINSIHSIRLNIAKPK